MTLAMQVPPDVPAASAAPVVELENLVVDYVTRKRTTRAVDGVSSRSAPARSSASPASRVAARARSATP